MILAVNNQCYFPVSRGAAVRKAGCNSSQIITRGHGVASATATTRRFSMGTVALKAGLRWRRPACGIASRRRFRPSCCGGGAAGGGRGPVAVPTGASGARAAAAGAGTGQGRRACAFATRGCQHARCTGGRAAESTQGKAIQKVASPDGCPIVCAIYSGALKFCVAPAQHGSSCVFEASASLSRPRPTAGLRARFRRRIGLLLSMSTLFFRLKATAAATTRAAPDFSEARLSPTAVNHRLFVPGFSRRVQSTSQNFRIP